MNASARYAALAGFLQSDPDNPLLLADTADAAIREGRIEEARALVARGVALQGETPEWLFRRATACMAARDFDAARATLAELEAAGHGGAAVQHNLAYIAMEQGRIADARARLAPLVADTGTLPPSAAAVLWMRCLHHAGELDAAWDFFCKTGVASGPLAAQAAVVALDRGDPAAARPLAEAVLAAEPHNAQGLLVVGALQAAAGQWQQAAAQLRVLTSRHPHQPRGWVLLGLVQLALGEARAARACMEAALALREDAQARIGLGWARLVGGAVDAAREAFSEVLRGDTDSVEALCGLGVIAALQGEQAAAQDVLARLDALEPGSAASGLIRQMLAGDRAQLAAFAARLAAQLSASAAGVPAR